MATNNKTKKKVTKKATVGRGRPTKYKKKYCKDLIAHMETGLSFETFAAVINVDRDTIYHWTKVHEDFSDAKKEAFQKNQLFWEKLGISGAAGKLKNFNSTAYIYNVKNRFRNTETFGNDPDNHIKISGMVPWSSIKTEKDE